MIKLQLDNGEEYGETAALLDGRILVSSRMPMRDACKLLIARGADPYDRVEFTRGDRLIGQFRLEGPTKWPDTPIPRNMRDPSEPLRVFNFNHDRRNRPARAGGPRHHQRSGS